MTKIILITGGQRSGKSSHAEEMALLLSEHPIYIATAKVWDEEFRQRVERHRSRRGGRVVLIDCVTLWLTNFFFASREKEVSTDELLAEAKEEFDRFTSQDATFIFVTNEIGSGGVSDNALQRRFTDLQGWMNQYIASRADTVVLMVSGIPVNIKSRL